MGNKIQITEELLGKLIGNAIHKKLVSEEREMTLNELFAKNKEWKRLNPTLPFTENPYPRMIESAFLSYLFKNYKMVVLYSLPWEANRLKFIVQRSDMNDILRHAVFDCESIDDCAYLLKRWVCDYYEERIYEKLDNDHEHSDELYEYDIKIEARIVKQ